jgi:altronate dehydratase large subunit
MGFFGYTRADQSVGIRNHVVVMAAVNYANGVVAKVARELPDVKPITHTEGDGRSREDLELMARTLVGLGKNPNVAAVLVIGLGSEAISAHEIAKRIAESGKPVEVLVIQEQGGSQKTTQRAVEIARRLLEDAARIERSEHGFDKLTVAVKCGGSDALSGITANPAIGVCADWLVSQGGKVILSETTEMIGTESILSRRAASPEVAAKINEALDNQKTLVARNLGSMASAAAIAPGNVAGGITSIQEKSLGCIIKGGTSAVTDVIPYAVAPTKAGLNIMDTPGSDIFCITGSAAGGAQIIIFSTGRGSPAGFPIVPVIKVCTNSETHRRLNDDMDLDAGRIIDGVSVEGMGQELRAMVEEVCNGKSTKAEANLYDLLSIHSTAPAIGRTTLR